MNKKTNEQIINEQETTQPELEFNGSRQFVSWLNEQKISLGFSTYQSGKVFLIGLDWQQEFSVFERTLERPMGMCVQGDTLWISTLYQLYRFKNMLPVGHLSDDQYDRLFVPQKSYITADLDIHDIAISDNDSNPVFVNTLFSCLATASDDYSFKPVWQPSFITELVAEDRCHLNGLAIRDNQSAYVSAVARSNVADGWRDHRKDGGVIIDVQSNEIIAKGLSMPHSPRWANGQLWVANSGTGEFGHIDLKTGKFEAIAFCPGYIRGVSIYGDYAIVGLSKPRNKTFTGLALDDRLSKEKVEARCALYIIDLKNGGTPHWMTIEGFISELYDVVCLPNVKCPSMIGFRNEQIRRMVSIDQ